MKIAIRTWFLVLASFTATSVSHAEYVSVRDGILLEITDLKDSNGHVYARETVTAGTVGDGTISWNRSGAGTSDSPFLRQQYGVEKKPFKIRQSQQNIVVRVIPFMGGRLPNNEWYASLGRFWFKSVASNPYKDAIVLSNGLALDIAFQDTRMTAGPRGNFLHYGLAVKPDDVEKVLAFLDEYLKNLDSRFRYLSSSEVTIEYEPRKDTFLVRLEIDREGQVHFEPILKFNVAGERPSSD